MPSWNIVHQKWYQESHSFTSVMAFVSQGLYHQFVSWQLKHNLFVTCHYKTSALCKSYTIVGERRSTVFSVLFLLHLCLSLDFGKLNFSWSVWSWKPNYISRSWPSSWHRAENSEQQRRKRQISGVPASEVASLACVSHGIEKLASERLNTVFNVLF